MTNEERDTLIEAVSILMQETASRKIVWQRVERATLNPLEKALGLSQRLPDNYEVDYLEWKLRLKEKNPRTVPPIVFASYLGQGIAPEVLLQFLDKGDRVINDVLEEYSSTDVSLIGDLYRIVTKLLSGKHTRSAIEAIIESKRKP
jgi:hypothetical protein